MTVFLDNIVTRFVPQRSRGGSEFPAVVSRQNLLTSISTRWCPLTTVQPWTYWTGGKIMNQCILQRLLSPAAISAYQQLLYSGRGSIQLPGVLSQNRDRGFSPSKWVPGKAYWDFRKRFPGN